MSPLRLKNMNHISRVCKNLAVSKAFYQNVLGFVEVVRPSQLEDTFEGSWLFGYNMGIHLIEGEPVQRKSEIDPMDEHMSFQCDSFSDVVDALENDGIKCVQAQICHHSYVINQVFFHDPDHNMIEICTCECMPVTPLHSLLIDQRMDAKPGLVSLGEDIRINNSKLLEPIVAFDDSFDPSLAAAHTVEPQLHAIRLGTCA